jgi:DNA mismatch endonuclease (patch repair protein)
MADVFSPEERSNIMRRVKSKRNQSTEIKLIAYFKQRRIKGWRRNYKIKGNPDFVFLKPKIAVFADGCFWHGHDCRNTRPKQNEAYWNKKRERNQLRDEAVNQQLRTLGWVVVRVWECDIKKGRLDDVLAPYLQHTQNS